MIKIEIHDDLIDWLEKQLAYGLHREECAEFAQEFVSYVMATDAMTITIETPDLLTERDALRTALTLIVAQFEGIDDDKWSTEGMKVAIQQARAVLDAAEVEINDNEYCEPEGSNICHIRVR